jgi:hypothetical protein
MITRIVSRLVLLLVALATATALVVGGLSVLASGAPDGAAPMLQQDQVAAVQRAVEAPAEEPTGTSPTPAEEPTGTSPTPAEEPTGTSPTPAEEPTGTSPTPAVVLVFAGIVLMAALPPIHRVHVYHRSYSYHRPDWF